jgi:hypothetical protein
MPKVQIHVTSDANGYFHRSETFNPAGPFPLTVELTARLLAPDSTTASGSIAIDAVDGDPRNQAKDFAMRTGERFKLGAWRLDGGNNTVVVSGKTTPVRPNQELAFEIEASL